MNLQSALAIWIEHAWREMGKELGAEDVPVGQYKKFDTDDLSFPFKNLPLDSWRLISGKLISDGAAKISRVPYIAFCLDEASSVVTIQVQWAPRCGYGWELTLGSADEVVKQKMCWVS